MPEKQSAPRVKLRLRDTCITSCIYYPGLRSDAEAEQAKINAAREAGAAVAGSSVKVVCPHDATKICSGFVSVPEMIDEGGGGDSPVEPLEPAE